MTHNTSIPSIQHPDRITSYFRTELSALFWVTVSGILYNIGMTAGPYFEGLLAQRLFDVYNHQKAWTDMLVLALWYLAVIGLVQGARCVKRFYVRRFANNTGRNMRHTLYHSLVHKSKTELEAEGVGNVMTKAMADVDACVEGMRKFTTEIFDTGVVLAAYLTMLFVYDWRLALLSGIFPPIAYLIADRLKKTVTGYNAAYKKSAGRLNEATLDRISNAVPYRVYGREADRDRAYDRQLSDYEKRAVAANVWGTSMQPIYNAISMCGAVLILTLGARNVLGSGWTSWDIAAFTTFLSCFTKMAKKSASAAKLFNAVQKAAVSWERVRPLMEPCIQPQTASAASAALPSSPALTVSRLSFSYPGGQPVFSDLSFTARAGEIIGITGPVASGKSTLGKVFLCETPYTGSILIGDKELRELNDIDRSQLISYLGHQPELMSDTLEANIRLGDLGDLDSILAAVCFDREVKAMPEGIRTFTGSGGSRLSGGQQARIALARTLYHGRQLLILDDPFSAVDPGTEKILLSNLRRLAKDKIVLLISHRLYHFPEFDRIIWLNQGRAAVGSHAQLLKEEPLYAQLYHAQEKGGASHEQTK